MQGDLAQLLGLTMTGNAFLDGRDIGRFWPEASIFAFCRQVSFVESRRGLLRTRQIPAAPDPMSWLRGLKPACTGLRAHFQRRGKPDMADWMTVGLSGCGPLWQIESLGPEPRLWTATWTFTDGRAGGKKPWSVDYHASPPPPGRGAETAPDLDRVERQLAESLESIAAFAERIGSGFATSFRRALATLQGDPSSSRVYHPDLAPEGFLEPRALRILNACQTAWVFGGMGSWSDGAYGGDEAEEGDRLTEAAFGSIQSSLAAIANSTCPAR